MAFSAAAKSAASSTPPKANLGSVIPPVAVNKIPTGVPVHGVNKAGKPVAGKFHGTNPNGIPQVGHYQTGKIHTMGPGPLRFHPGRLGRQNFGSRVTLSKIGRQSVRGKGTPKASMKMSVPKGTPIHGMSASSGKHVAGLSAGVNALNQPLAQSPQDNSITALHPSSVRLHETGTLNGVFLGGSHSLSSFTSGSTYGSPQSIADSGAGLGI